MSALSPLSQILNFLRNNALHQKDYGTSFEYLCLDFLKNEPEYKAQFVEVLPYGQWVENYQKHIQEEYGILLNRQDKGIDLVAKDTDGKFTAVQCKFYEENHTVAKSEIDSFIAASEKVYFVRRLVFVTGKINKNVQEEVQHLPIPLHFIGRYDLENSRFDWQNYLNHLLHRPTKGSLKDKKELREYQQQAVNSVKQGLENADRGKMIMACGTGKTFTALKIAEEMAGLGKTVLFLVPSLSLLDQTISEWVQNSALPLNLWAVCSDSEVGKKKASALNEDDYAISDLSELQYPATTDAKQLSLSFQDKHNNQAMSVIFSTYHSLQVLRNAQLGKIEDKNQEIATPATQSRNDEFVRLPEFDLIICDEAHRTTGYAWENEEISVFSKITDKDFVLGKKRLFMTATPRVYQSQAKEKEKEGKVELYSMDDETKYGKDLFVLPFSKAVSQGLLVDYKVVIFSISEDEVRDLANLENAEISVSDAAKIVGCWKALSKQNLRDKEERNTPIMKRSVAFCTVIDNAKQKKGLVGSKQIKNLFAEVVNAYRTLRVKKIEELSQKAGLKEVHIPPKNNIMCEVEHIDGSMNAVNKKEQIQWLKDEPPENTCRILSNVRCLTEGVDVPALDAIMFLTPKSSKVDVVQAVGRVMRKAPNKQKGYVILPVVIPSQADPNTALDNNQNYKIVWEVLNALRSHDDEFDALLNRIDLMKYGELPPTDKIEVISYAELASSNKGKKDGIGGKKGGRKKGSGNSIGSGTSNPDNFPTQEELDLSDEIDEISEAIYAKIVKKCGNTKQWEEWAEEVSVIAEKHIAQIKTILADKNNTAQIEAFNTFSGSLKNDLNKSLSDEEIVQMLAQHMITEPVFKALFSGSPFVENNPVSQAIKPVLAALSVDTHWQDKKELQHFYDRVEMKIKGIKTLPARQALIKDLYDNFFNKAFAKMAEKLGIVYTPIEVVDFIIHSVERVMNQEFSGSLKDKGVHILDPFTGTGTFITRLLQSGIIPADRLTEKYQNDIHANEIVLLAYYIAAVNIESVFYDEMKKHARKDTVIANNPNRHNDNAEKNTVIASEQSKRGNLPTTENTPNACRVGILAHQQTAGLHHEQTTSHDIAVGKDAHPTAETETPYLPFNGICLTDTFETHDYDLARQPENSQRIKRQKEQEIRVIIGNPPYSAGQKSANDNNQNKKYEALDERVRETYTQRGSATNKNSLGDTYIKAIRWASDRIGEQGVIGFITNAGWIDSNSADGLRKCLAEEFTTIYVLHLRGNIRAYGKKDEGGNIFGIQTPVAIIILVKNPNKQSNQKGQIYFHDLIYPLNRDDKLKLIQKYQENYGRSFSLEWLDQKVKDGFLTDTEKLAKIADFHDINGITAQNGWTEIIPDAFGDWINQRDPNFDRYISIGDKKDKTAIAVFENYSGGVKTNRDTWCWNFSQKSVAKNIGSMIDFYNSELKRYQASGANIPCKDFVNLDTTKWSYGVDLEQKIIREELLSFEKQSVCIGLYRPFSKSYIYYSRDLNDRVYQMPKIFPLSSFRQPERIENEVIYISGNGNSQKDFSVVASNVIPDLNMQHSGGQAFPRYLYEVETEQNRTEQNRTEQYCRPNAECEVAASGILSSRLRLREQKASLASCQTACPTCTQSATVNASHCGFTNKQGDVHHGIRHEQRLFSADDRLHSRCAVTNERTNLSAIPLSGNIKMNEQDLFGTTEQGEKTLTRRHAISDAALAHFREPYADDGKQIQKDDVFYFIYGLLHSEEYRKDYADNLSKQLPRIPRPKTFADFCHFANAGLDLADLHLNYETVPCYDGVKLSGVVGNQLQVLKDGVVVRPSFSGSLKNNHQDAFRVVKMKFIKKDEKETIVYNNGITISNIPIEAYEYIVNGKSAIEWVMERQAITVDKASGIQNNANDFAIETMNNPRYPLELLLRVITVSLETMKIVNNLPELNVLDS